MTGTMIYPDNPAVKFNGEYVLWDFWPWIRSDVGGSVWWWTLEQLT